ncbi:MAG TPA: hypothetical protein VGJ32_01050 [Solirubrobacteraceae bacterium]
MLRRHAAARLRAPLSLTLALIALAALPLASAQAAALPADWQKGADFTSWWSDDYAQGTSDQALAALRDTGTTHVAFVTTWYMDAEKSSSIAPDGQKTPSDQAVLHAMATAKSMGMTVELKPHVDVRDGTFRGAIHPADPAAWFASYRAMLDHYADLAQQAGAAMLVVGTELTSMSEGRTAEWRQVIADARARFKGQLAFAANQLDGAEAAGFWGDLDYIGIDAYMPLAGAGDDNPTVQALGNAWYQRGYVDRIQALHAKYGKPVIFTEGGYESRYRTAATPWGGSSGASADEPQARAYQAMYCVWSQVDWFKGVYWWDWGAKGASGDDTFTPRGKQAETTMRAWNAGTPEGCPAITRTSPAPAPAGSSASGAGGQPGSTPAAAIRRAGGARTVVSLSARRLRGTRRARLSGRVRRGTSQCTGSTVVAVVERWDARRHRWVRSRTVAARTRAGGTFALSVRRLRRGAYRVRATVTGGPCGRGVSRRLRLRLT